MEVPGTKLSSGVHSMDLILNNDRDSDLALSAFLRDKGSNRWMMMFAEHQTGLAVSYDPNAYPNTWFKWNGGGFNSPGLYGPYIPAPGLDWVPGSNPSLHWNTHLERWVVIYNGWNNCMHISSSDDGIYWDGVRTLTCSMDGSRACECYLN